MVVTSINNVLYGGPISNQVTEYAKSAGEFFLDRLQKHQEAIVLIEGVTGVEISAAHLRKSAISVARSLEHLGIKNGATVGICCENRAEFAFVMFGTILLNAAFAPFNFNYTQRELNHMIKLTRPEIIFTAGKVHKNIVEIVQGSKYTKYIISLDVSASEPGIISFTKFLNLPKFRDEFGDFECQPTNIAETVLLILPSSGTTGLPKGVQLTQKNILQAIECIRSDVLSRSTVLNILPWFHCYGCIWLLRSSLHGTKSVYLPKFDKRNFLNCIQRYKAEVCLMVPSLMAFLSKSSLIDQYDLSSLKVLICGAAPLSNEIENAVKRRLRLPSLQVRQGYALTETSRGVIAHSTEHPKPGSIGTLTIGVYGKVVDIESGATLGSNRIGEFCFKGDMLMKGYVGDEEATNQVLDGEGWLHTGDIGYYDNDFEFFYVDRIKELIKYKGYQVAPAEIESLLLSHPKIKDAAVIGIPDEMAGELPMGFVVKQSNVELLEKEVDEFVTEHLSSMKRLRGGVKFVDSIPRTVSGKILRRVLKDVVKKDAKAKL